jgi:hypothetical protein
VWPVTFKVMSWSAKGKRARRPVCLATVVYYIDPYRSLINKRDGFFDPITDKEMLRNITDN